MSTKLNFHTAQKALFRHGELDGAHWITLEMRGEGSEFCDVAIFVRQQDHARFRRAAEAFNEALVAREPFAPPLAQAAE